jgi:hypothetical protein
VSKLLPFNANNAEEYFINECIYWRDTANKIFQNDNKKRDSANQVYSAEYQMAQGKYRAFQTVCEYMAKFDLSCCDCSNMVHSDLCAECKHKPERNT